MAAGEKKGKRGLGTIADNGRGSAHGSGLAPVATLPPLKPAWFHILLALAGGSLHGYAIRASVETQTAGRVKLWPANLYGSIKDMTELDLLEPLSDEEQPVEDQRRQYYRLTHRGRDLLRLESDRLQALVDAARASQALA